jgi:lipid-A-disaccharide synthase-like uncharacterized protein
MDQRPGGCLTVFTPSLWLVVGFLGQGLFTARFVVQWLVAERKQDSVVPEAFWWLSLLGGALLLCYAIFRHDPVIIIGQIIGLLVYLRNLMLVNQTKQRVMENVQRLPVMIEIREPEGSANFIRIRDCCLAPK